MRNVWVKKLVFGIFDDGEEEGTIKVFYKKGKVKGKGKPLFFIAL